jgi:hypothetical protein
VAWNEETVTSYNCGSRSALAVLLHLGITDFSRSFEVVAHSFPENSIRSHQVEHLSP